MKLSKFMIAENPITSSGEFILHTRKPALLMQVIDITNWSDDDRVHNMKDFNVYGLTEVNGMNFLIVPAILFDSPVVNNQADADKLAKLFKRAGDWWHAYIKFEDNNHSSFHYNI